MPKPIPFLESIYCEILKPDMPKQTHFLQDAKIHFQEMDSFWKKIDLSKTSYRYAPEKWSVSEMLGHCIDCQYLLMYRILNFTRGESFVIPGAQEDMWVQNAGHDNIEWKTLLDVYNKTTQATVANLSLLNETMLQNVGNANGILLSAKDVVYYMIAHERHHVRILKEKYL